MKRGRYAAGCVTPEPAAARRGRTCHGRGPPQASEPPRGRRAKTAGRGAYALRAPEDCLGEAHGRVELCRNQLENLRPRHGETGGAEVSCENVCCFEGGSKAGAAATPGHSKSTHTPGNTLCLQPNAAQPPPTPGSGPPAEAAGRRSQRSTRPSPSPCRGPWWTAAARWPEPGGWGQREGACWLTFVSSGCALPATCGTRRSPRRGAAPAESARAPPLRAPCPCPSAPRGCAPPHRLSGVDHHSHPYELRQGPGRVC